MRPTKSPAIDVRQLRLSKWILPKTQSVSSISFSPRVSLSASCFGIVEVLEIKDGRIPYVDPTDEHVFHTKHSISLYAPADNSKDRRRIRNFWKNQAECVEPLYICMVRLTDNHLNPLEIQNHIFWAFQEQAHISKNKFLYYYSLDFCDLVLFVQGVRFSQYLTAIEVLNFRAQGTREQIVRDTISIYAVRPDVLTGPMPELTGRKYWDKINVTLRLGVLDVSQLQRFYQTLEVELFPNGTDPDISCEMSLGRSDFTLYARGKTYPWIVRLCQILDCFTDSQNDSENNISGFLTFDISVGMDYKMIEPIIQATTMLSAPSKRLSTLYLQAQKLEPICKKCQGVLEKHYIRSSCLSEIYLALTDLLKDGFASDFVLSVYESFWHLCDYINRTFQGQEQAGESELDRRERIQKLLEAYTGCLSTIVNCTMHSDREFIQIPSFNLFLHPVPPKLLAFYTAAANQIAKCLTKSDQKSSRFTFLFLPSYEDGVNVNSLMPADEFDNRILAINIQESLLVTPEKLLPLIGHEIGHYAGRETRNRDFRTNCYLASLLSYQLDRAFFSEMFGDETANLSNLCTQFSYRLRDVIMAQRSQEFENHHFSNILKSVMNSDYLLEFLNNDEVMLETTSSWAQILDHSLEETQTFVSQWCNRLDEYTQTTYFHELWNKGNSQSRQECLRIIAEWCYRQIIASFRDDTEHDQLYSWYNWLENAYREAYSDIVMLSLLELTTAESYKTVLIENLTPDDASEYNRLRVSAVTAVLGEEDSGWITMKLPMRAHAFQHCALDQLTMYLTKCQKQLQLGLADANIPHLGQIYQKLCPNTCRAEEIFSLLRAQSERYRKQLCSLSEV